MGICFLFSWVLCPVVDVLDHINTPSVTLKINLPYYPVIPLLGIYPKTQKYSFKR